MGTLKENKAHSVMADIGAGKKLQDAQVRANLNQRLIESGEKERLKDLLRTKLVECGWRDELKVYCKEVIKTKGLKHVTVEDLVAEITPHGRCMPLLSVVACWCLLMLMLLLLSCAAVNL